MSARQACGRRHARRVVHGSPGVIVLERNPVVLGGFFIPVLISTFGPKWLL